MTIDKWRDIWTRFSGQGVYPHELAFLLDTRLRHLLLTPQQLANSLQLTGGMRVLEIGPGPGYFSVEVARRIPGGQLVLLDIQSEMLVKSRNKTTKANLATVTYSQGSAVRLPFRGDLFDVAFLVTVLGEVPDPGECIHEISRVLRRDGLLSVTEMSGDPDALTAASLARIATPYGLEVYEQTPVRGGFTLHLRRCVSEKQRSAKSSETWQGNERGSLRNGEIEEGTG